MSDTLMKIKSLEKYCQMNKTDQMIDSALSKLIELKISELNREIDDLQNELKRFEFKYRLDSEQFFQQFNAGQLGDSFDFTEWIAIYKMLHNRIKDKTMLLGQG